jgi:CheY-like chemotaxis protein
MRKLGYYGPIIGVTGNALDLDRQIYLKAGASRVLIKPVTVDLIRQALSPRS